MSLKSHKRRITMSGYREMHVCWWNTNTTGFFKTLYQKLSIASHAHLIETVLDQKLMTQSLLGIIVFSDLLYLNQLSRQKFYLLSNQRSVSVYVTYA